MQVEIKLASQKTYLIYEGVSNVERDGNGITIISENGSEIFVPYHNLEIYKIIK